MAVTTVTLDQYRALAADARAALRMIREAVEMHAPPGSVPSEESIEPPFVREAEALVNLPLLPRRRRPSTRFAAP